MEYWFNNRESKIKKNKNSKNSNITNDNNTKKKKKKRFLTCFSPDSMEGFLFPKLLSPPLTLVKKEEQEKDGGGGRKKHRNARLSRILKAIFTGTFLAKKVRKRKCIQNSFTPETNIATKTTVKTDSMKQEDNKLGNNSNLNSTPSPKQWQDKHTNIVEENEEERCGSLSKQIVQDKDNNIVEENTNGEGRYGCIIALSFPLISLLGSIYWNKALSFFCTATGFFLIRWSSRYILPKHRLKLKSKSGLG